MVITVHTRKIGVWGLRLLLLCWLSLYISKTVSFIADSNEASLVAPIIVLSLLTGLLAGGLDLYLYSRTRETEPGFPVLFEPPFGIFPALGVRIADGEDSSEALQATLFDLAERGLLQLAGDDDAWNVTVIADPAVTPQWPAETSMLLAMGLTAVGDSFVISQSTISGGQIAVARMALQSAVSTASKRYLTPSGPGIASVTLGWLAYAGSFFLMTRLLPVTNIGLLLSPLLSASCVFAFITLSMMFEPGICTIRNEAGRDIWSRTGGFARFLATESSESRFETAKHLDRFLTYLPWAIALGSTEAWADSYEAQDSQTPVLPWILWSGAGRSYSTNDMITSFNSAVVEASDAYTASQGR